MSEQRYYQFTVSRLELAFLAAACAMLGIEIHKDGGAIPAALGSILDKVNLLLAEAQHEETR